MTRQKSSALPRITFVAILIGFGHSLLAMSGEESLAQVYREIEAPKHQNLLRTGLVIFVFSVVFTSLVSCRTSGLSVRSVMAEP